MRALLLPLLAAVAIVPFLACGPSKQKPKSSTDTLEGDEGPGFTRRDAGAAAPDDAGTSTTTITTLDDGGDHGTKLTPLASSATASGSVAAPPSASASAAPDGGALAGCDPGRCTADIYAEVQSRRALARACYDAALKDHPGIEGKLVVSFIIDPKGKITAATLNAQESQISEPSVLTCISDIIKKIQFPASPRGRQTNANYRFEFHPRGR